MRFRNTLRVWNPILLPCDPNKLGSLAPLIYPAFARSHTKSYIYLDYLKLFEFQTMPDEYGRDMSCVGEGGPVQAPMRLYSDITRETLCALAGDCVVKISDDSWLESKCTLVAEHPIDQAGSVSFEVSDAVYAVVYASARSDALFWAGIYDRETGELRFLGSKTGAETRAALTGDGTAYLVFQGSGTVKIYRCPVPCTLEVRIVWREYPGAAHPALSVSLTAEAVFVD